jgi:digeranylgeranylglycerophospholipid reductase
MDVKIAGAGPAGCVAAISALKSGNSVHVFEEHMKGEHPQHCSGLISGEGMSRLSSFCGYNEFLINSISRARLDFCGESISIEKGAGAAHVINREGYDRALAEAAEAAGAKFTYGARFPQGNHGDSAIIGADGAISRTALAYGFPRIRRHAYTLKCMARMEGSSDDEVRLYYDSRSFGGFFGWFIPHSGREGELGIGVPDPSMLKNGWDRILSRSGASALSQKKGKVIPLELRPRISGRFGGTNVLLCGDAAGQVKASSGGGVVFGTEGGELSGKYADAPEKYESEYLRKNRADLLAHRLMYGAFSIQPPAAMRMMARTCRMLGMDKIVSKFGSMDRPTRSITNALSGIGNRR